MRRSLTQKQKRKVWARDRFRCRYCGRKLRKPPQHFQIPPAMVQTYATVDHVIPRCRGGSDEIGNLVTSCWCCNRYKGNRTPDEAGMVIRSVEGAW